MSYMKEIYTAAGEINTGSLLEVAETARELCYEWGEYNYEREIFVRKLLVEAGKELEDQ